MATLARSFAPARMLDLGCGLGQLTRLLAALPSRLVAADLSPAAVQRAREDLRRKGMGSVQFLAARSTGLPVMEGSFDLVVASDGLYSWDLEATGRATALKEIGRAVSAGGRVIFTEHLRPSRFGEFVREVKTGGFRVETVFYLYDRPSYQVESWLKAVQHWRVSRAVRRSILLARALSAVGSVFGARGSRHICIVARKA